MGTDDSLVQNVLSHGVVVVLDHALFVEQGGGAVADFVEQVGAGPVEDGHEVVADDLDAELRQPSAADYPRIHRTLHCPFT